MKPIYVYLLLASTLLVYSCKNATTFELLSGDDTGIHFSNKIVENDSLSILKYEYLYNGSGVGMGDFNNDGLVDIIFSGSQANASLYINKGEMKFEELGKASGLDTKDRWCSGVSLVDINGDGLLDVYVSATMKNAERDRQNMLFVNQGIKDGKPSFKELATEYGINDSGHSEHAAFFDYDRDGDLDLYVLTDVIDQVPSLYRPKVVDGSYVFDLVHPAGVLRNVVLNMGGLHNVENAIAAIAIALCLGIEDEKIIAAVADFKGVKRRFEYKVKTANKVLIDDYAHHPEELSALISGVKSIFPNQKMVLVFQPHLYSRTQDQAAGFSATLDQADEVILLPIYPARELPIPGVTSDMLLSAMTIEKKQVMSKEQLMAWAASTEDKLIVMAGAGDIDVCINQIKDILTK